VAVARARGLRDRRITTAYVGRNAILPLFTQLTISAGFIVGGSVLIEFIFVYQGIGYVLNSSIAQRDYPVMQGVFLVITISVVVANLVADLLYGRLDPRIRVGGGSLDPGGEPDGPGCSGCGCWLGTRWAFWAFSGSSFSWSSPLWGRSWFRWIPRRI
jgi:hypothetical protein